MRDLPCRHCLQFNADLSYGEPQLALLLATNEACQRRRRAYPATSQAPGCAERRKSARVNRATPAAHSPTRTPMSSEHTLLPLRGARLFLPIAAALLVLAAAATFSVADPIERLHVALRATARASFVLFLIVFTTSALATRWPGPVTDYLVDQRRTFGLCFAFSHFVHGLFILTLGMVNTAFWPERTFLDNAPGSFGYLSLLLLVVTCWTPLADRIRPRRWLSAAQVTGLWIIASVFLDSYYEDSLQDPWHGVPTALIVSAMLLRLSTRQAAHLPQPAP